MQPKDRFKLWHGPYTTPRFKYGKKVLCEVRGEVEIVGLSDGKIPWPIGKKGRAKSLIVYKGLAKAVRRESNLAIQHWWGVGQSSIWKWRKAFEVPLVNDGTRRLKSAYGQEDWAVEARKKAWKKARDPGRRAKIAAAKRGKPRPKHVLKALRKANLGKKHSAAARKKMIQAQRKRGARPPWLNPAWTESEDELCRTRPAAEVAELTGRSRKAVHARRRKLGVRDLRERPFWTKQEDKLVRTLRPAEAAERTGRTMHAVKARRQVLGLLSRKSPKKQ